MGKKAAPPSLPLREQVLDTSVRDKIAGKLESNHKIPEIDRPKKILPFPDDVTILSSDEVGKFLAMYDAEVAYIRSLLAGVEVQVDHAKIVINTYRKRLYLQFRSDSSIPDAQAWVDIDTNVVDAEMALHELETERSLLQSRLDNFMKYPASISREISRRKNDSFGMGERATGIDEKKSAQSDRIKAIQGKELDPKKKDKK